MTLSPPEPEDLPSASYVLLFSSTEDCRIFFQKLWDFSVPPGWPEKPGTKAKITYWYNSGLRGPIYDEIGEDYYKLTVHCIFHEEPPAWFMDRVVEFSGLSFDLVRFTT